MDDTDVEILARLSADPLASLAAIGRDVRLTRNAVQARVKALGDEGPLVGFVTSFHPGLVRKVPILAVFGADQAIPNPARTLEAEDVWGYSVNHDGQTAVTYWADRDDAAIPNELERMFGGPPARRFYRAPPPLSPPGAHLSKLQWAIVEQLIPNARVTDAEVARRIGRDARTVANQRRRLRAGGYIQPMAAILSNRARGVALFHLYVQGTGPLQEEAIVKALPWARVFERTRDPPGVFLFCRAASFGDALAARDRVLKLKNVAHAEIVMEREGALAVGRIQGWCRAASKAQ